MSRRRKHAKRQPLDRDLIVRQALAISKAEGCTCEPDVTVRHTGTLHGVPLVQPLVRHDRGCPLENAGRSRYMGISFNNREQP